ncbi:hypothetical protein AAEU42_13155 [Pseudoflavonifractor phocaeensis]|uniref:hypothetical protein n=1 Tax=Pseudoflavonifractor phocaeensis TaxID=1870988 RepID=UPI00313A95B9
MELPRIVETAGQRANRLKLEAQNKREAAVQMGGTSDAAVGLTRAADALEEKSGALAGRRAAVENESYHARRQSRRDYYETLARREGFQTSVEAGERADFSGETLLPTAQGRAKRATMALRNGDFSQQRNLAYLTGDERDTFLAYIGRRDYESAWDYLDTISWELNARAQGERSARDVETAKAHPLAASVGNVVNGYLQPFAYAANTAQAVKNLAAGEYEPTDPNSQWFSGAHGVADTAAGVHAAAVEWGGEGAGFLADTGLSILRNLSQLPLGQPGALMMMSAGAAGGQTLSDLEAGATPGQAAVSATLVGAAEYVTEKLPIDNLFRLGRTAPASLRQFAKELGKQMASEAVGESLAEVIENAVNYCIYNGTGMSDFEQMVDRLVAEGMSEEEAKKAAFYQIGVVNVGLAGLGGAISGGVMGAGAQAVGYMGQAGERRTGRAIDSAYEAMGRYGLFSSEAAKARGQANQTMGLPMFRERGGLTLPDNIREESTGAVDTAGDGPYNGAKEAVSRGREEAEVYPGGVYESSRVGAPSEADAGGAGTPPQADRGVYRQQAGQRPLAGWAEGHVREVGAEIPAGRSAEISKSYIPDVVVVEDSALKARKMDALALTSDGVIYLSDAIPAELEVPVGYHEVVHAVEQRGSLEYQNFIDSVGLRLDRESPDLEFVIAAVTKGKSFEGKSLIELNLKEASVAFDELNALVWGFYKADPENARAQFAGVFRDYDAYISELDAIMEGAKGPGLDGPGGTPPGGEGGSGSRLGRGMGAEGSPHPSARRADTFPQGKALDGSVGAAQAGFDPFSHLQNETGSFHPDGEKAARQVDVPTQDGEGRSIPKSAATVLEAGATPDSAVGVIQDAIARGEFSFDTVTDAAAQARARKTVTDNGFDGAKVLFHQAAAGGRVSKDTMALGQVLLNNAMNAGDSRAVIDLLTDYSALSTASAQAMQAQRMLKKLSPEGQLYAAQRSLENYQAQLQKRLGDKAPEITVDPALYQRFLEAGDAPGRDAALGDILQSVADQVPATWRDKWNAWRYLSMLGNPRTHVRNIVGNAGFVPVRMVKDAIATALEAGADYLSPKGITRTKAALNPLSAGDRALVTAAFGDIANVEEELLGSGKYMESAQGQINDRRTIFAAKPLEALRKANSTAMDVEDTWFSKPAYAGALAGYLKANGVTAEAFTGGTADAAVVDAARAYAVREAQRATYRDANALSDFVARAGKFSQSENPVARGFGFFVEGVLPFKRTPANILARGLEYSPAGLVKSLFPGKIGALEGDLYKVRRGKMTAAEAIDNAAAGLTGVGLLALGLFLAAQGLVSGGGGDDRKQDAQDDLTGGQAYALSVGGKNYTLDWLAPEALPFFVGVELWNVMDGGEGEALTAKDALAAMERVTDPMLEMSMLQGLQDALAAVKYNDAGQLPAVAANAAVGYLSQGIPTLFGQLERTLERERQTTFVDRESGLPNDTQYLLGKMMNKLPGEFQQVPYIDAWGRREETGSLPERAVNNFLNPAYVSRETVTEADREVQRLHDAGFDGVFPQRVSQSEQVEGRHLTADGYVAYATITGRTTYELVSDLIASPEYKTLTDQEKADAVALAYRYAKAVGKEAVSGYEPEAWVSKAQTARKELGLSEAEYLLLYRAYGGALVNGDKVREAYAAGMAPEDYLAYAAGLSGYNADGKGGLSLSEQEKAIDGSGLSQDQREILWLLQHPEWAEKAGEAGVSLGEYIEYKAVTAGCAKKAEKLRALQEHGMSYVQAARLYGRIEK